MGTDWNEKNGNGRIPSLFPYNIKRKTKNGYKIFRGNNILSVPGKELGRILIERLQDVTMNNNNNSKNYGNFYIDMELKSGCDNLCGNNSFWE